MSTTSTHGANMPQKIGSISLEATIIRADGTHEPQGRVAFWHRKRSERIKNRLRGGGKITPDIAKLEELISE